MKGIIIIFGLLTVSLTAQTVSLHTQRLCFDQAAKVEKDLIKNGGSSYSNHYDPRTKTCWVEEFSSFGNDPITYYRSVYNAFEQGGMADASFAGELGKKSAYCWVGDKQCHSIPEFDMLVSQRYGLR